MRCLFSVVSARVTFSPFLELLLSLMLCLCCCLPYFLAFLRGLLNSFIQLVIMLSWLSCAVSDHGQCFIACLGTCDGLTMSEALFESIFLGTSLDRSTEPPDVWAYSVWLP